MLGSFKRCPRMVCCMLRTWVLLCLLPPPHFCKSSCLVGKVLTSNNGGRFMISDYSKEIQQMLHTMQTSIKFLTDWKWNWLSVHPYVQTVITDSSEVIGKCTSLNRVYHWKNTHCRNIHCRGSELGTDSLCVYRSYESELWYPAEGFPGWSSAPRPAHCRQLPSCLSENRPDPQTAHYIPPHMSPRNSRQASSRCCAEYCWWQNPNGRQTCRAIFPEKNPPKYFSRAVFDKAAASLKRLL
jgi:hypothetical protein